MNKEDFTAETGHNNSYAQYMLIGKDLSIDKVINMLEGLYDDDELSNISQGKIVNEHNGYTMISFDKHKGVVDDLAVMTSKLKCSGYAELPWDDYYSLFNAENGEWGKGEGFSVEWDKDMPCEHEDYDADVKDDDKEYDAFIMITDTKSGIKFQSGRGAVSSEELQYITNFVNQYKNSYLDIDKKETKYYGVVQTHYGVDYRWIFDEETLSKEVYAGDSVPDEDEIDYFPIGGSNSGPSRIVKLDSDEEIKAFLTAPAEGPDYDDPALGDIGDYYLSVENDCDSCTDKFVKKFNLTYEGLQQFDDIDEHYANVERMAKFLKKINYPDFDYDDPFSGKNREMRYSELCDIYEKELANAKKHNAVKGKTTLKSKSKAIGR